MHEITHSAIDAKILYLVLTPETTTFGFDDFIAERMRMRQEASDALQNARVKMVKRVVDGTSVRERPVTRTKEQRNQRKQQANQTRSWTR